MTTRLNPVFPMSTRERCVPPPPRILTNFDRPPRLPPPVVIVDSKPEPEEPLETSLPEANGDDAVIEELVHLMFPNSMTPEDGSEIFFDAVEEIEEYVEDTDSESESVRYLLPAWSSPNSSRPSTASTNPDSDSARSDWSGQTAVVQARASTSAPIAVPERAVEKADGVRTRRLELRDLVPEGRSREEIFEKGVPWGFHGRDYLAPEPKTHALKETLRGLPVKSVKKGGLFSIFKKKS
jgi:hypothetical protein